MLSERCNIYGFANHMSAVFGNYIGVRPKHRQHGLDHA